MYADDAVIFTHDKNYLEIASTLTSAMVHIDDWLTRSCLYLNSKKKTVCMVFTKKCMKVSHSNVFLRGQELDVVNEFKYLGVIYDSTLTFKYHVKKVANKVTFSFQNFKQVRPFLNTKAAKLFLYTMIFSHIEYCFINWSLTGISSLKTIESLFKKAIKIFDKKALSFHHCNILERHNFLSFDNFRRFKYICLVYNVLNNLAPPPLHAFFQRCITPLHHLKR